MTVIYNNKDTGMLVNLKEVYSGMRATVAPSMPYYENSLKKKIASDLDFGSEVIVEHTRGGKASGRPGYHFTVYVQGFDTRKQALLNAYLDNLINSGGFVYGDKDNGMVIGHPLPNINLYQGRASVEHFKKMEQLQKEKERQLQLEREKERKIAEKERRRKSIIPTFRSDLDFVIRVPEAVLNSSDIKEAGSLLAAVEKSVRQVYRKLNQAPKNISIPVPQPRIKGFKKAIPEIPTLPPARSNSKVATPFTQAKNHYSSEAILNAELEALKSKAFMPNETTLVLPAGSFNKNMYYLLSDLFEATEAGATLGFEKFTKASTPTTEAKFDEIIFTTMPIEQKEPTATTVTASGDEVVGSNTANNEDKGLSNLAIGGIVAAVVVVGVGAFYLGKRR
jgi:hypothetical protein